MLDKLRDIAKAFNENDIIWAVGASLVLKHYGLVDEVHDIDLIVSSKDIAVAIEVLDTMAKRVDIPYKEEYKTKHFYVYEYQGVSIDVMSGFRIQHNDKVYRFPFDDQSIAEVEMDNGVAINYGTLEDWYVAYHLMKGRGPSLIKIRQYWNDNGIAHPELFERWLSQGLPHAITDEIKTML